MRTILVPTDFSEAAREALNFALRFANHGSLALDLILMNTYFVPPVPNSRIISTNDELRSHSLSRLEKEALFAKGLIKNKRLTTSTLCRMGTLKNVILQVIEEKKIDLVILGIRGSKRKDEVFDILNRSQCPVLIVPSGG